MLFPAILFAQDEEYETNEDSTIVSVMKVTDLKTLSASLATSITSSIHNAVPRVDYTSVVEFNKVYHQHHTEPYITQVIFWDRRQKQIEIDFVLCTLNYAYYTKVGLLDYYVVKDWRMEATVSNVNIEEIGEGQHCITFIDKGAARKLYCGRIIYTDSNYDPERFNLRVLQSEKRTLLTP